MGHRKELMITVKIKRLEYTAPEEKIKEDPLPEIGKKRFKVGDVVMRLDQDLGTAVDKILVRGQKYVVTKITEIPYFKNSWTLKGYQPVPEGTMVQCLNLDGVVNTGEFGYFGEWRFKHAD
jgi:hypothetical protein